MGNRFDQCHCRVARRLVAALRCRARGAAAGDGGSETAGVGALGGLGPVTLSRGVRART